MKTESITNFADLSTPTGAERNAPVMIDVDYRNQLIAEAQLARGAALARVVGPLFNAVFGKAWQAIKAAQAKRRNFSALNALDDRMLRDMGIDRGQILGLVSSGVTGFHPQRALAEVGTPANLSNRDSNAA